MRSEFWRGSFRWGGGGLPVNENDPRGDNVCVACVIIHNGDIGDIIVMGCGANKNVPWGGGAMWSWYDGVKSPYKKSSRFSGGGSDE